MSDDKDKPSLAVVIAKAKDRSMPKDEPDEDDDYSGEPSPECVSCAGKLREALDDKDDEAIARALQAFLMHAGPGDEE